MVSHDATQRTSAGVNKIIHIDTPLTVLNAHKGTMPTLVLELVRNQLPEK